MQIISDHLWIIIKFGFKKDSKLKHRKKLVILLLDIIYWNYYVIGHVLWDKTMVDKLIYTPIDYKQNYPFYWFKLLVEKCSPGTTILKPTIEDLLMVFKVFNNVVIKLWLLEQICIGFKMLCCYCPFYNFYQFFKEHQSHGLMPYFFTLHWFNFSPFL